MSKNGNHILLNKILFSFACLFIYIVGRNICVYGVDVSAYTVSDIDAESVLLQSLSGDINNISIFILGLMPYMTASILAMVLTAIRSQDNHSRQSANWTNNITLLLLILIGIVQAILKISTFVYLDGYDTFFVKTIGFFELIAGMFFVVFLGDYCAKYGIGGKSAIILVNLYAGLFNMMSGKTWESLILPISIGVVESILMLILENTEKRIGVQRVSIHSIYSDKNYIAYKFNPVGIMPVMFASAFFGFVQMLVAGLSLLYADSENMLWIRDNMTMTYPLGMVTYIILIWILNIVFSYLTILPVKAAEGLLKSGDSIENLYAGKKTKLYLAGSVIRLSIHSSIVMSVFIGIPFVLQYMGYIDPSSVMIPSSLMMTTGLWITMFREAEVYQKYDSYKAWI